MGTRSLCRSGTHTHRKRDTHAHIHAHTHTHTTYHRLALTSKPSCVCHSPDRLNRDGNYEIQPTHGPAGERKTVTCGEGVHGEESQQLEPGDGVRVMMGEEGAGEGGEEDGLLVDLEGEQEED